MKGFSNQLIEKHRYLKNLLEEYEDISQDSLEKVKCELDKPDQLATVLECHWSTVCHQPK